ncbi:hypothetical protein ACFQX6_50520 [Streptosporangium lutulentum]
MSNLHELPADLPVPENDGAADHLPGRRAPHVELPGTGVRRSSSTRWARVVQ